MLIHPEVAAALTDHRPVVALESTIISHGLPRPDNLAVARQIEEVVRAAGAVPATIAMVGGQARIGLSADALTRIATSDEVVKASLRDLAMVKARRGDAATTVASTAHLAARAGIAIFATGGLGGVHRDARHSFDESADLATVAATPILVVCSGVKSILDVPATLERMESLNIAVMGYRTDRFPGFYRVDSGFPVDWRMDSPADVVDVIIGQEKLGTDRYGTILGNPVSAADELDGRLHDETLAAALAAADQAGIRGKDVTPFLLDFFNQETQGAALATNVALVLGNAALAAEIAVELAERRR
jgi:pseudouridine-5'-phosphate glycosidase